LTEYELAAAVTFRVAADSYAEAVGRASRVERFLGVIARRLEEHGVTMKIERQDKPVLVDRETFNRRSAATGRVR
jgi:hypothetical protein